MVIGECTGELVALSSKQRTSVGVAGGKLSSMDVAGRKSSRLVDAAQVSEAGVGLRDGATDGDCG